MYRSNARLALPFWGVAIMLIGCSHADSQNHVRDADAPAQAAPMTPVATDFNGYWHQGKAEVTRFALEQARYGQIHKGDAVLIFVTEDFLGKEQVKLESEPGGRAVVPILKLNCTKKFNTGVYPYSMMTSVFTPEDLRANPRTLKVATSVQEWCGHTFTQFNLRGGKYNVELRSYFEKEGDRDITLDTALLEDEVWTRLRLAPENLPTGTVTIIPSTMAQRLRHTEFAALSATVTRAPIAEAQGQTRYTITYPNGDRTLAIDYETAFPHRIMAWSETYRDGFGDKAKVLTTRAVRTNELMIDYWSKHFNEDAGLRGKLGLP